MGTPDYADNILKRIIDEDWLEIVGVFTQPDKPVGRKKVITPPPVKITAIQNNLEVFQPEKLRNSIEDLRNLSPDFIIVAAYGQILSREILDLAPSINLHTSILPKYRGASPIQQALLNGDKRTGVTAMLMEEGLDSGDILAISQIQVDFNWKLEELYLKLTDMAGDLILDVLNKFDEIKPISQRGADATHCKKIEKNEGEVSFHNSYDILKKFKAFSSWPSIYLNNGLKLIDLEIAENGNFQEGEILKIEKDSVLVGCKTGSIYLKKVQPKSKSEMSVLSYINGKRLKVGDLFL
jgi:methionyl-tRNA formyltransferase